MRNKHSRSGVREVRPKAKQAANVNVVESEPHGKGRA